MKNENKIQETDAQIIIRSKFRAGIWVGLLFMMSLIAAFKTYPFVGYTSTTQNLIYGIIITSPFWISLLIYLVKIWRDKSRVV